MKKTLKSGKKTVKTQPEQMLERADKGEGMKIYVLQLKSCSGCPFYSGLFHGCYNKKALRGKEHRRPISKHKPLKPFPAWCPLEDVVE